MNIGVVILHYLNFEETKKCLESFEQLYNYGHNIQIVVVDNASFNGSDKKLKTLLFGKKNIHLLKLEKNLGFAKGNNAGLKYLQQIFTPDFIVYSNSDIEFKDKFFFGWLVEDFKKYNYGVLGPDIYSVNYHFHQSPCKNMEKQDIKSFFRKYLYRLVIFYILDFLSTCKLNFIYKMLQSLYRKKVNNYENLSYKEIIDTNVTLHGALFILSKNFLQHYEDGICSETFLYLEENILKAFCDRAKIKMVYDGTYSVNHMQAASTSLIYKRRYKREIFRLKQMKKSAIILLKYL